MCMCIIGDYTVLIVLCSASTISVEEDVQYVVFEVRRTFGSQGEVSVAIATTEDTAVAPTG